MILQQLLLLVIIIVIIICSLNINYIYNNNMFISTLIENKRKRKMIIDNKFHSSDFFNVALFKSSFEKNNFMLIIQPQNYHFFIENDKLIYHPNNQHLDGLLRQYSCQREYDLVYSMPLKNDKNLYPKVICHKNLKYLKSRIYKAPNLFYYKKFEELQEPMNAINIVIRDIIEKV